MIPRNQRPTISTKLFKYDADYKCFVADTNGELGMMPVLHGFFLASQWTGKVAEFIPDGEREVLPPVWWFKPTIETVKDIPELAGVKVQLLNRTK
jgi:hypothetical protein